MQYEWGLDQHPIGFNIFPFPFLCTVMCRAEKTSQFDTGVVSQVSPQDLGRRRPRGVPKTLNHPKTITPIPMLHNSIEGLNFNGTIRHVKRSVEGPWSLYGVFQLSNRVACTSPNKPSLNLCNLSCDSEN